MKNDNNIITQNNIYASDTYIINDERLEITYELDSNPFAGYSINWDEPRGESLQEDDSDEKVVVGSCDLSGLKVKAHKDNPNVICLGESRGAPGNYHYSLKEDYYLDSEDNYQPLRVVHPLYEYAEDAWDDYNKQISQNITCVEWYEWCLEQTPKFKPWQLSRKPSIGLHDRFNDSTPHEERENGTVGIVREMDFFKANSGNYHTVSKFVGVISPDNIADVFLRELKREYTEKLPRDVNDELFEDFRTARYIHYFPELDIVYKYDMDKGCYEKIPFSSVSSRLYEITKKELGIAYLDAAEYAHTVEEDKGKVEIYPWIKLLTRSQKLILQESCSWFFTKATSLHKDALYALKHKSEFIRNEPLIGTHSDLVNVKNGVVNLQTKELLPHNPKYEFTYRNDGNYLGKDCEIEPSHIFEFFNSAFKRPDLHIDTIRSAVLVGLTGSGALTQCFVELTGQPGSGKGTTQKLITFAIGATNTYGTQIERLANRFETAAYINKLHLRIGDASKFLNDRIFIMITGADELAVELKNKSITDNQAFKGIVTLSSNSPIMISDSSLAIERIRILVAFNPRKDSNDRTLLEIVNGNWIGEFADELDAFVTWCLNMSMEDAINHLRAVKKAIDSSRLEGFLETNVVARFLNDSVVKDVEIINDSNTY